MRSLRKGDSRLSLPLFALAHVGIFAGLFRGIYSINASGTGLYYDYAGRILTGQLPYRDFVAEYPPLALALFALPRVLGESFRWFYVWFQFEVVLADLAIVAILFVAARKWQLSPWRVIGAYTIAVLAVGPITLQQYDIVPALFSLVALLALVRAREGTSGAFLALGVMTKVYPLLLAPMFAMYAWSNGRSRQIVRAVGAFALTCIACMLPWLIIAPGSLAVMVDYHAKRGIQIESTWSSIAFIARALGLSWLDTTMSFGSWNVSGPLADFLAVVSPIALVCVLATAYWWTFRRLRRNEAALAGVAFVARASLVVLLASLAASKVFSPQYLVWLTPFFGLIERNRQAAALLLFVVAGMLTTFVYPFHYRALLDRHALPISALVLRDAIIVALPFVLARAPRAEPLPA